MMIETPHTLTDALRIMTESPTTPIAGGTDLFVNWHHKPTHEFRLLDLSRLHNELGAIRMDADSLELGALTTYWDVLSNRKVCEAFSLLADAARQVGSVQIQTRGTWAGNIGNGSPAADGVPVMMAYDANVVLQSTSQRREVPLDKYWSGYKKSVRQPDELIVAIRLPRRTRSAEWFHKVGARSAQTITKVGVAVVHDATGWRVCVNSVAPFVCRCRNMENALSADATFASPTEIRDVLAKDISPIDDIRSTASYRTNVLARLLFSWMQTNQRPITG